MPQLKGTPGFRVLDDPEKDYVLEYPKSWVGRANRQRQGLSVSDYNVSCKAVNLQHLLCSIATETAFAAVF